MVRTLQAQMHESDRSKKVDPSNFCSEFAVSELVDDDKGGEPRIAIFHHTTASNEFSADTPSHTTLSGTVASGKYEYFQVCVAEHMHHHR